MAAKFNSTEKDRAELSPLVETARHRSDLSAARTLIRSGAQVYRYPRMTHMKVLLCDDWASVGSANLDTLSMCINRELNLAFCDLKEIHHLEAKVFKPDFQISQKITLKETESFFARIAETVADQL